MRKPRHRTLPKGRLNRWIRRANHHADFLIGRFKAHKFEEMPPAPFVPSLAQMLMKT